MKKSLSPRYENARRRWMPAGSVLICFASITPLVAAFGPRSYNGPRSSLLLTLVLIALCTTIILHARFLILARREHREIAKPTQHFLIGFVRGRGFTFPSIRPRVAMVAACRVALTVASARRK